MELLPFPRVEGGYRTIVADPPWPYGDSLPGGGRGASKHYSLMTIDDIAAMPIGDIAADNGHLYMWVTNSFFEEAYRIVRDWGYIPKTIVTWVKVTKTGTPHIGMGRYFRNTTEHVIFATKGKEPPLRRDVPNVFFARRGEHSAKPEEFYNIVRSISPEPRLDIFSRRSIEGFDSWGLEAPQ